MTRSPRRGAALARAFLGVGASLSPEENIPGALRRLGERSDVAIVGISTFYRTPPLPAPGAPSSSRTADPDFLNGVLEIRTDLPPDALVRVLAEVEDALGRARSEDKYAPRTMDLDLLLYFPPEDKEGQAARTPVTPEPGEAHSPHPDIRKRAWVALPLLELAPDLCLPPGGIPLREIAAGFPDPGGETAGELTRALRREFLSRSPEEGPIGPG